MVNTRPRAEVGIVSPMNMLVRAPGALPIVEMKHIREPVQLEAEAVDGTTVGHENVRGCLHNHPGWECRTNVSDQKFVFLEKIDGDPGGAVGTPEMDMVGLGAHPHRQVLRQGHQRGFVVTAAVEGHEDADIAA